MPVAMLLILVVLLSAGSGIYAGASFFGQQAPGVTVTTTLYTATTSWTTSTIWSIVTETVQGVLTTVEYTTSTSTATVTGPLPTLKTVTAYGNAQIDTAQSKFGGASGLFDGSDDYVSTPDSADWYFGTGDFTIDFWVRFNALPAQGSWWGLVSQVFSTSSRWYYIVSNEAGTYYYYLRANEFTVNMVRASPGLQTGQWYHLAVVRSGNNFYMFQDGVQCGTTYTSSYSMPDVSANLNIGSYLGYAGTFVNGWFDEFRISKGVARWTSNFTPPTSPYPRDANTVLLLHMDGADGSTTFIDGY